MTDDEEKETLSVPCRQGMLIAIESGDPGNYDEIEVNLVRKTDHQLIQLACIGTDPDGTLHVYTEYEEAGPNRTFLPDVEGQIAYPYEKTREERGKEYEMGNEKKADAKKTVTVALVEPMRKPRLVEMPAESGEFLASLQDAVDGYVEAFDPLWGDWPCLFVNEEGIYDPGCPPNRAVYATEEMARRGYISQLQSTRTVRPGELYTILFGTIVAVCHDAEGKATDIDERAWLDLEETFGTDESMLSGIVEALRIKSMASA